LSPNETPWPGLNYRTANSMPGLRREFQKNDRLATHTALGELFIPDEFGICKGSLRSYVLGRIARLSLRWQAETQGPSTLLGMTEVRWDGRRHVTTQPLADQWNSRVTNLASCLPVLVNVWV
jgi:hypothetical protein